MAIIEVPRAVSLDRLGVPEALLGTLYTTENSAHKFIITGVRGEETVAFDGYVTAQFIRPDGATIEMSGGIEDGKVTVTLPAACYVVTGRFTLTVFDTGSNGAKVAVYACVGNVRKTTTDTIVDPGSVVPNVSDIVAEYTAMQEAAAAAYAAAGVKYTLVPYNSYDLVGMISLPYTADMSETNVVVHNGITYAWSGNGDERTCTVSGTATSASQCIMFPYNYSTNKSSFPYGMEKGKTYRVFYNNSSVRFDIVEYDSSGNATYNSFNTNGTFSLANTTVGVRLRLFVASGTTISPAVVVAPRIVNGATNAELNPNKGVLADAADLNDVVENGNYVMALSRSYKHTPWSTDDTATAMTAACALEVVRGSDSVIFQRITYGGTGGREYNRRTASGVWTDWNRGVISSEMESINTHIAALMPYNAVDGVAGSIHTDSTINNVSFHWLDGNTCEVTCSAAASESAYTWIYYNTTALPDGFTPGKTVHIKYSSSVGTSAQNVWLEVRMYPTGVWSSVRYYNTDGIIKIPDSAVGMAYRLTVAQGLEPDETVTVAMITDNGAGRCLNGKYVAFGDSLTAGAVWRDVDHQDQPLFYAATQYQMPTRIARALGAIYNYDNAALGGAGYIKKASGADQRNIVELVKAYDYTGVEVVTIMGGANDKAQAGTPLGSSASTAGDGSICGAIKEIINWFKDNPVSANKAAMQKIQLIFIQPTPSYFDATHDPWTSRAAGGWSMNDFDAIVSELCRTEHVGYVNWMGCTYCDTWAQRNVGYSSGSGPNYTHPIVETDYALIGDFIAGKVAQYGQNNKPITDPGVKAYTTADMYTGAYWHFGRAYTYFDPSGRRATDQYYNCLWFPVKTGNVVRLRTVAGSNNAKPYALIGSDRLIYDLYTGSDSFDGEITIQQDGFVAVNARNPETYGYYDFLCEVRTSAADELRKLDRINALPIQTERQQFLDYDDNDVCKVLVTGPSRMSMIHNWAIIGASFDSGEFNHALTVYPTVADYQAGTNGRTHWAEYEGYEYSCFEYLKRINGIPNMYLYSNGGQNSRDWIRYGPTERKARTWAYTTGELEVVTPYYEDDHFWYISDDPNDPRGCTWHSETDTYTPGGNIAPYRTGAGHAGGNWWKLREDLETGKRYNAYLINLGSNDLNNNHGSGDPELYDAGTLADIGTYDRTTNTDTVPTGKTAGVVPGVVNSYAAYMGAILNRIFSYQPDAIVFVATIRNNFSQTSDRLTAWDAYNDVLKDIVATAATEGGKYYGKQLYLLDNAAFGPCYDVPPMNGMFVHNHPNALGYQYIAGYWNTLIDYAIQKNYLAMQQSMFIGTNMTGTV